MTKIHYNILTVLFSFFGVVISFFIFSEIFSYFYLRLIKNPNWFFLIFFKKSSCDPSEFEPNFFSIIVIFLIGILSSRFLAKIIFKKYSN